MCMARSRYRRLPWAFVFLIAFFLGPRVVPPAAAQTADVGQWNGPLTWPCVAINLVMLPTGKVIFWPRDGDIRSWDPVTGNVATVTWPGHNIFCTGHSLLADGRMLLAGGAVVDGLGLPYVSIYNPFTDSWTQLPNMNAGRWYPTSTTLADGSALVVSGSMSPAFEINDLPQIWNGGASWRNLTTARSSLPLYPFMFLAPNGKVFNAGPNTITRYLDTTGTGAWTNVGARVLYRDYGSAVMYDTGKVMLVGGADPPTNSVEVIDLNAANPVWRTVNPMTYPRRHCNATLLADGKVLVNGGVSGAGFSNRDTPVYPAEIWDPATETWTRVASQGQPRWYHSTAVLLPDGRVVSAGGDDTPNAEVYSPPYLFKGTRPTISSAPGGVSHGETFFVGTPQPDAITKVNFIRAGSATHAFNMDQRLCRLSFTRVSGGLNITAPSDSRVAPPGYYMLFLLNANGVPSVARMVRLGGGASAPPAPPSTLTANTTSNTQIALAWADSSTDEDGFSIERSTDGVTYTPVTGVGANVTSYEVGNLSPGTTYRFRVYAYKGASTSGYSPVAMATTASSGTSTSTTPPLPPSNPAAANISTRQINLTWTDNSNDEEGFAVESSVDGAPFTQIAAVPAGVTLFPNTGLQPATTYYYRVRAFRGAVFSPYTTIASSTTFADGRMSPLPPYGLNAIALSTTQINLEWIDGSFDEDSFQVERSLDGIAFTSLGTVAANITTFASTNLAPGTTYYYRVRANRGSAGSYFTGTASATTLPVTAPPPPPSPPAGPTNLRVTPIAPQQINLTWGDNSGDEDGFAIERSTDGSSFSVIAAVGANVTGYSNVNLSASTAYWYRVRAYRGTTNSSYSNTATTTTPAPPQSPPPAPTNLRVTAVATSQINLAWNDNSGDEDGFTVERSTDDTNFNPIATVGANVTSYSSGGLNPATSYSYRVRAFRGTSNSGYSNTAAATTNALPTPPPTTPGNLVATAVSSSQINLAWSDSSNDEDGFAIERSTDGTSFSPIATVGANVTGYSSTGLSAATTYAYRIRAYRGTSFSAFTPVASATTSPLAPAAPTGLIATATSSSQINLTWTDNSSETGFVIERSLDGTSFTTLASVAANVTSYSHNGLAAGSTVSYRVYATGSGGDSGYSNRAQATTLAAAPTTPAAPSSPMAVPISASQISLTWFDNSANETSFVIERSSGGSAFQAIATVGANMTTFVDGATVALTPGTTYSYRIRSQNAAGASAPTATVSATTAAAGGGPPPPPAPLPKAGRGVSGSLNPGHDVAGCRLRHPSPAFGRGAGGEGVPHTHQPTSTFH